MVVISVALMALGTTANAQSLKKGAVPNPNKGTEEPFDTLSQQEFSYMIGLAQLKGLKAYAVQNLGMDTLNNMEDFIRGVEQRFATPGSAQLTAYTAGMIVGEQVQSQFIQGLNKQITGSTDSSFIDLNLYRKAFLDGLKGNETPVTVDSAAKVASRQMQLYRDELTERQYGENRTKGEEFLKENAKKDSVVTLPSGVQYKILRAGDGPTPNLSSTVKVDYEGKLIDGTVFDSSYKRGKSSTFKCSGVIKGWSEILQLMPVGSLWEVYIPQELAYGNQSASKIPPFSTLIFKIELLGIEAEKSK